MSIKKDDPKTTAGETKTTNNKKNKQEDDLSPEDLKLKTDLEQYINTIISFEDYKLTAEQLEEQKTAIKAIAQEMRDATTSMTAIPKPLKFLREHIPKLREYYDVRVYPAAEEKNDDDVTKTEMSDDLIIPGLTTTAQADVQPSTTTKKGLTTEEWPNKPILADLLSLLTMVLPNQIGLVLKYRLDSIDHKYRDFDLDVITSWGIAHVQCICGELSKEYQRIVNKLAVGVDANNISDDSNNSNDGQSDDKDVVEEQFDDLADDIKPLQKALSKTQSILLKEGELAKTASTTSTTTTTGASSIAAAPTMNDDDSNDDDNKKKDADKKKDDDKNNKEDDKQKDDGKKKVDDKKKKELTDEEKAKIEEEELKLAKEKQSISTPVTDATLEDIRAMAERFLPHLFQHGCEIDAVDMLFETDNIQAIIPHIDLTNYTDVLQYVEASNKYNTDNTVGANNAQFVNALVLEIYLGLKLYSQALSTALHITPYAQQKRMVAYIFYKARDEPCIQLQLAYMLAQTSTHVNYLVNDFVEDEDLVDEQYHNKDNGIVDFTFLTGLDYPIVQDARAIDVLQRGHCGAISQAVLNNVGVTKSRQRNDICRAGDVGEDAHEWFAVGLANCGTKLLDCVNEPTDGDANNQSTNANTTSGSAQVLLAKAIATGMIHIGDVEEGYSLVDPYLNPTTDGGESDQQKAKQTQTIIGGIIATALCGAGVNNDFNAGMALLADYITETEQYNSEIRTAACYALGLCYLGSQNVDVRDLLIPLLIGEELDAKGKAMCALSLGMVFVGSSDQGVLGLLFATIDEVKTTPANQRIIAIAIGLVCLRSNAIPEEFETMEASPIKEYLAVCLDLCAYIGSGDVMLIQSILRSLSTYDKKLSDFDDDENNSDDDSEDDEDDEDTTTTTTTTTQTKLPPGVKAIPSATTTTTTGSKSNSPANNAAADKKKDGKKVKLSPELIKQQKQTKEMRLVTRSLSVLAITFISLVDDLTKQCCHRILLHLLDCGSDEVRSAIPLAISLLNVSSPSPSITDLLIRLTHDQLPQLATNATLAIGLTAAGSNNSRSLAGISGMLSETHDREVTRIGRLAQGLTMLGQGTLTLSTAQFNDACLSQHSLIALILILTQMVEIDITTSENLTSYFGLCAKDLWYWSILSVCARPKVMNTILVNTTPDASQEEEPQDCQIPVKIGQVQGGVILGRKTVLSGVQVTHAPVVVGVGTYVQVDDDDYTALTHCLEGNVLVTKQDRME